MADEETKQTDTPEPEASETPEIGHSHAESGEDEVVFVEDPVFEIDYKGDCAYEVRVSIPAANTRSQSEKLFAELQDGAEMPGFRRGRAPRKLIERKFNKAVRGEVAAKLATAAFEKLLKDNSLRPYGKPVFEGLDEVKELPEDQPLAFKLKIEVSPRVTLGTYRGIEVERPVVSLRDADIDEALDGMRHRFGVYADTAEPAQDGDQVIIDFEGKVDGANFPGGTASNYPYILGTKRFFPEFEEVIRGRSKGGEVTCEVLLGESMPNPDLRGKTAQFTIRINGVKRRTLPELDDDFAKQVGAESLGQLRERVAAQLRERVSGQSEHFAGINALNTVIGSSTFELPKSLVRDAAQEMYDERVKELISARLPMSEIRAREEELRASCENDALADLKRLCVLNEIIAAEKIEVTDEEMAQEVESLAQQSGVASEAVERYLKEGDRREVYGHRILRNKALRLVMAAAHITDKEVPEESLNQESDQDA